MELDYPSEYLMRVTWFYGYEFETKGFLLMRSICFFTNKKIYGSFGDERGIYFTSENDGKDGKVVGFHGRDGWYLDAIGMHMEYNKDHQEKLKKNDAVNVTRINQQLTGLWVVEGITGTTEFPTESRKLRHTKESKGTYDRCGFGIAETMEIPFGLKGMDTRIHIPHTIELDYPSEYLMRVTGFHGYESGDGRFDRVRSCFFSNMNKYGPFGDETCTCFSTENDGKDMKIIGFHGRAGCYFVAIGMYM